MTAKQKNVVIIMIVNAKQEKSAWKEAAPVNAVRHSVQVSNTSKYENRRTAVSGWASLHENEGMLFHYLVDSVRISAL